MTEILASRFDVHPASALIGAEIAGANLMNAGHPGPYEEYVDHVAPTFATR